MSDGYHVEIRIGKDFFKRPRWRGGVTICPYCDYQSSYNDCDEWFVPHRMREVALSDRIQNFKTTSVQISSACPKCFKVSYHHVSFGFAESMSYGEVEWPKDVMSAIRKEKRRRVTNGKRLWDRSLCKKCRRRKKISWDCLYPHVQCYSKRGGRSGSAEAKECDRYLPPRGSGS